MAKMTKLKKLTAAQLNKMINETKAELKRRETITAATLEIRAILKKYKIDIQEIDAQALQKTSISKRQKKTTASAKSRDQRRAVKAKYKEPDGTATWTGRGRTPSWVLGICAKHGIDVDSFKKDDRFQC
jgi:DNA-binding protein H-NS